MEKTGLGLGVKTCTECESRFKCNARPVWPYKGASFFYIVGQGFYIVGQGWAPYTNYKEDGARKLSSKRKCLEDRSLTPSLEFQKECIDAGVTIYDEDG